MIRPEAELPDLQTAIDFLAAQTVPVRTTSPDLVAQLRQAQSNVIRRIVCIGVDLDDTCDVLAQTRQTRAAEIEAGLALLTHWFDAKVVRIDQPSAETTYPNLLPEMLVLRLIRKRLPAGALPTEMGVLIVDVLTAAMLSSPSPSGGGWVGAASGNNQSIADLRSPPPPNLPRRGRDELPVILDDHIRQRRFRATVPPETPVSEILALAGVAEPMLLRHGPLVADRPVEPSTPIGQTDLQLHVLPPAPIVSAACTRCGECVAVCPVRIHPAALLQAAQLGNACDAARFDALACIECGLCTAVCPSSLPVRAGVIAAKRLVA